MTTSKDAAGVGMTPGQVLERLQTRITDLEQQLADAHARLQDRRRLQDLSPEELAVESIGAAGEIIKAARLQAAELRNAAQAELTKASQASDTALADAQARADRILADANQVATETVSSARNSADTILRQVREEADAASTAAKQEAIATREAAQREHAELLHDGQVRLQAAIADADLTLAEANAEARRIVDAAKGLAESLQQETWAIARGVMSESLVQLDANEQVVAQMLEETAALRGAVAAVLDQARQTAENSAREAAKAEAVTRSYLTMTQQLRGDLTRRLASLGSTDAAATVQTPQAPVDDAPTE